MKVEYHRDFKKDFQKLNPKQQKQFQNRVTLFMQNPAHPFLRVHELRGAGRSVFSFNVSGDMRVLFVYESGETVLLIRIGTHAQLYG